MIHDEGLRGDIPMLRHILISVMTLLETVYRDISKWEESLSNQEHIELIVKYNQTKKIDSDFEYFDDYINHDFLTNLDLSSPLWGLMSELHRLCKLYPEPREYVQTASKLLEQYLSHELLHLNGAISVINGSDKMETNAEHQPISIANLHDGEHDFFIGVPINHSETDLIIIEGKVAIYATLLGKKIIEFELTSFLGFTDNDLQTNPINSPAQESDLFLEEIEGIAQKHVFISYVREDITNVDRIIQLLEEHDIQVWKDTKNLRPGQRWKPAIKEAIEDGAYYICCFSSNYVNKKSSYMNKEIRIAIEQFQLKPFNEVWFLPVLLDECDVPKINIGDDETVHDLQWVRLYENWEEGMLDIIKTIK